MPKIFLLLSAALLLASSGLSYLNKNKLTASLDDAKTAHAKVVSVTADDSKAHADLKKAQKDAADAALHTADVQTQLDGAKTQVSDLTGQVTKATSDLKAKEDELAKLNAEIANIPQSNAGGPSVDIAKQIEDLKHSKDELQLVKDSLDTQLKGSQNQLVAAQKRLSDIQSGAAMLGLRGRVLAVNREYNFVVLDLGSRNGVSTNATMIVERGGSMVGRIRTVSVEPSQTVADIVPNSVPAGVIVQPGDTVIFQGS